MTLYDPEAASIRKSRLALGFSGRHSPPSARVLVAWAVNACSDRPRDEGLFSPHREPACTLCGLWLPRASGGDVAGGPERKLTPTLRRLQAFSLVTATPRPSSSRDTIARTRKGTIRPSVRTRPDSQHDSLSCCCCSSRKVIPRRAGPFDTSPSSWMASSTWTLDPLAIPSFPRRRRGHRPWPCPCRFHSPWTRPSRPPTR